MRFSTLGKEIPVAQFLLVSRLMRLLSERGKIVVIAGGACLKK